MDLPLKKPVTTGGIKPLALLLFAFFSLTCYPQKSMNETEFTRVYLESLRKAFSSATFRIDSDLKITAEDHGKEFTFYLKNAFSEYKSQPASIDEVINRYIKSSSGLFTENDFINLSRVIPMIKPAEYLNEVKRISAESGKGKESGIVWEKYNDDLIIVYAEDTGQSFAQLSQENFEKLNIGRDSLLKLSVDNLNSILPEISRMGANGAYGIAAGGNFEASLILIKDIWTKENFPVDGEFVIAVPNRDLLFVTGSNNKTEIEKIRIIAEESYNTGSYPISPYLFKWNGNRFEKFE